MGERGMPGASKAPGFYFFGGDWLADPQLALASASSRGIWIDFLATACGAARRGELTASISQFAKLLRCTVEQFRLFLDEARKYGFASVSIPVSNAVSNAVSASRVTVDTAKNDAENDAEVTVTCRRMVRDEKARQLHADRQARYRSKQPSDAESDAQSDGLLTPDVTPLPNLSYPNKRKNICSADTGFAQFWKLYPKKVGKVKAEKAWRKLKPDAALAQLIIADLKTRAWATDPQFIPYPSTFLNGKRWEDQPDSLTVTAAQDSMPSADEVLRSKGLLS